MTSTPGYSSAKLTLLEIIDRTFRLYRQNFATFIGVAALIVIPFTLIEQFLLRTTLPLTPIDVYSSDSLGASNALCGYFIISLVLSAAQSVLTIGALTAAASETYMGNKLSIREAFDRAFKRFGMLLLGLFALYAILVAFFIFAGFTLAICAPALAFGIAVVIYVGLTTYTLMGPVLTLENVGPFLGINRAWALSKARFWTVIGFTLILGGISLVLSVAFRALMVQLASGMRPADAEGLVLAVSTILGVFLTPLMPVGQTIFYYDTRNRLEGLDFSLQALGKPDPRPFDVESPRPQASLNNQDLINIAILSAAGLVIAVAANTLLQQLINTFMSTGTF